MSNIDKGTVEGFGNEWSKFTQDRLTDKDLKQQFDLYFAVFDWKSLPKDATGFDMGCGSGRWAKLVAKRVKKLFCIDASKDALEVAKKKLSVYDNCKFINASFENIPLEDNSMDFGYSLGVLHHIPNTQKGINACVKKLRSGAPFLVYIYYAFDNKPFWFRYVWKISDILRKAISSTPFKIRLPISQLIAFTVYLPLARISLLLDKIGFNVRNIPLSVYKDFPFYSMKTDALDRFGTKLEKRYTKNQIKEMLEKAGLRDVIFSENIPYWCAVGYKI